ncbi:MAG: sulfatase [Verrucomicrobiota bacterium]
MNSSSTVLFFVGWLTLAVCHSAHGKQPNFVWILSEDSSKHYLKLFDESGTPTPNIEAMAEKGIVFDRAFSNSPVCSVARTTLITGCYGPRIGTHYHRRSAMAPMPDGVRMFPAYLRDAGYHTTNQSKTDYNATPGRDVWDASSRRAHWKDRKEGQPFFHKRSFGTSHESSLHFSAEKMTNTRTKTDPASVLLPPYYPDTPTFRYTRATYHDRIGDIDRQVGGVLRELEEADLLEDTFVFYFGDHGGVLPGSKGYLYETGLHVPLVVRIPQNFKNLVEQVPGSRTKGFVSFIDFGPTVLKLAGLKPPTAVDGQAFLGKGISDEVLDRRDEAFGYADRFDEKTDFVRTLRVGKYKYIRNYQPWYFDGLQNTYRYKMLAFAEWRNLYRSKKLNPTQSRFFEARPPEMLFDLDADPHETHNLAGDPDHEKTLLALRQKLTNQVKSLPDLSFFPESHLVAHAMEDPAAFGQRQKARIAKLVDLADWQLEPFSEIQEKLVEALRSKDALERYWALTVATRFAHEAFSLFGPVQGLAAKEEEHPLVRMRAAEFLGLSGAGDPRPPIMAALKASASSVSTNTILNAAVVLKDSAPGYSFLPISGQDVNFSNRYIDERVAYLAGNKAPARKKPARRRQKKNNP